jgi:hypothetical protein
MTVRSVRSGRMDGRETTTVPSRSHGWDGRRRVGLTAGGRLVLGLALAGGAGALTGATVVLVGALALGLLVVLDAVSALRALPAEPVGVRALGDGQAGGTLAHRLHLGRPPLTPLAEICESFVPLWGMRSSPISGVRRPLLIGRSGLAHHDHGVAVVATGTGVATAALAVGRRGLHPTERFTVTGSGPLGLVSATRTLTVAHRPPLAAGPVPVPHELRWPAPATAATLGETRRPRGDDLFRGVRPYRAGDVRRSVHWPATARSGSLMVRETEGTGTPAVRIVVAFATAGPAAEQALGRASFAAAEALRAGWEVWLVTCEGTPGRHVEGAVTGPGDLLRRLAAATPGQPAPRPVPVTTRWISPGGDRWR